MLNKIKERIQALSAEAEILVHRRAEASQVVDDVNVRLAQIVGAIQELTSLENSSEETSEVEVD